MYKVTSSGAVVRQSDGAFVPNSPSHPYRIEYDAWVASGKNPKPLETDAEKLARLQAQWRAKRDVLMRGADPWELPSFQARYGVTQQQVVDYKAQLYDVPETIEGIENFVWPARLK